MIVCYLRMLARLLRVTLFMRLGCFPVRFGGLVMMLCCFVMVVFGHLCYS